MSENKEKNCFLPSKIGANCLLNVAISIDFETSSLSLDVMPGILFEKIQDSYDLPVQRPSLRESKRFFIESKSKLFSITLSKDNIVFASSPFSYQGWTSFFEEFSRVYEYINSLFDTPKSIELRYINAFKEINIFNKLKLNIDFAGQSLIDGHLNISWISESADSSTGALVKVLNNTRFSCKSAVCTGSIIDITIALPEETNICKDDVMELLKKQHLHAKQVFFDLFTEESVEKLLKPITE